MSKECESVSSSIQSLPGDAPLAIAVPIIVRRCVEEIERRGLEIVGELTVLNSLGQSLILQIRCDVFVFWFFRSV